MVEHNLLYNGMESIWKSDVSLLNATPKRMAQYRLACSAVGVP
ncbi:hypothetical protein V1280_007990 [Bradyrhizobium sp. AZCC 2230]